MRRSGGDTGWAFIVLLVAGAAAAGGCTDAEEPGPGTSEAAVQGTTTPEIDARSYALGGIGAFAEMVGAGVKTLALSSPLLPGEMDALVEDATRLAEANGAMVFRETDFLVTDLFSAELTNGKDVLVITTQAGLKAYLALKVDKEALVAAGTYEREARLEIARRLGRLLSYSDEKIQALLDENEAGG